MAATEAAREIDGLAFQVDKSMRYHQRMRGFYETGHRVFMFMIISTGGGALSEKPQYAVAIAAAVVAINLVWSPSHRGRYHYLLQGRFSDFMIAIRTGDWTSEHLDVWKTSRLTIEKDGPKIFYAIEADCDNEVRRPWGRTTKMIHVGFWGKHTIYILRHNPDQCIV